MFDVKKMDKNSLLVIVAIIAIAVTGILVLGSTNSKLPFLNFFGSDSAVVKKSIDYLNSSVLQQGQTAVLQNYSSESGVIKMNLTIGGKNYTSYATRDGKLFFPQAFNLSGQQTAPTGQPTGQSGVDVNNVKTQGEPFVGKVNAPVVMAYWTDYQCPFCKRNEQDVIGQLVSDYVNAGKLKIIFKDYAFLGADSQTLGKFGRAVWQVAPAKFYDWHHAIFANQGQENSGWATQQEIMSITTQVLGASNAATVLSLVNSNGDAYQKTIDADKAEGTSFGINGTPGAIIGKQLVSGAQPYATFKAAIDAVLNSK